jgi:hypothetical protein
VNLQSCQTNCLVLHGVESLVTLVTIKVKDAAKQACSSMSSTSSGVLRCFERGAGGNSNSDEL